MFLASSVVFLGMAGFGMEVGTWYLERRHGQNTADAAAIAGVLQLVQPNPTFSGAQTAGINVATDNGYTSGSSNTTVTIQPGTWTGGSGGSFDADASGTCSPSCNAVRAIIVRAVPRSFTSLLMGSAPVNVGEVATAALGVVGDACSVALDGGLGFSGSAAVSTTKCSMASNRNDSQSITFNGVGANKTQTNAILVGAGGCSQNGGGTGCGGAGNLMYQPKTVDPYQALQTDKSAIPSAVNNTNCKSATLDPYNPYQISSGVFCIGVDPNVKNNSGPLKNGVVTVPSGTYFFYNAGLTVSGGQLTCSGCTIIFTGNNVGQLQINGGTVTMSAAKTSTYADGGATPNNYNGILFYMDFNGGGQKRNAQKCGTGNVQVSITGSSNITLNGGMYFPNASVCVTGSAFSSQESCLSLVAWSIYFNGNATENLTGCSTTGTNTAQVRAVNLVQ
jgi:hypothetical protein